MRESAAPSQRWRPLLAALGQRGWTAADISDWLWVARCLAAEPSPQAQSGVRWTGGQESLAAAGPLPTPDAGLDLSRDPAASAPAAAAELAAEPAVVREDGEGMLDAPGPAAPRQSPPLRLEPRTNESKAASDTPSLGIAQAGLIPRPRPIGRALAPLSRWHEGGRGRQLDLPATVEEIARARLERRPWQPRLRPRREPWLELHLLFDASPSMLVWDHLRRELPRLLLREGRWRDLRCWRLAAGPKGAVELRGGQGRSQAPGRLRSRSERSLLVVVSDGVAPAWFNGAMAERLADWAATQPVALLQVLPHRLWLRTVLGGLPAGWVRADGPMRPHQRLVWRPEDGLPLAEPAAAAPAVSAALTLPVITLDPAALRPWARLLTGARGGSALAWRFPRAQTVTLADPDALVESAAASPEELLAAFLFTSSASARRLLALLTFAPVITLPVVRLIHAQLVPTTGQTALADQAEVLFSGLFTSGPSTPSASPAPKAPPPIERQWLRFVEEGLRFRLREGLKVGEARQVYARVSEVVARGLGLSVPTFEALLRQPSDCADHPEQGLLAAFATIAPSCLRGLGREYEALADALVEAWRAAPEPEAGAGKTEAKGDGAEGKETEGETKGKDDVIQKRDEPFHPVLMIPFETAWRAEIPLLPLPFEAVTPDTLPAFLRGARTGGGRAGALRQGLVRGTAWVFFEPLQLEAMGVGAAPEAGDPLSLTLVEIPEGRFEMGSRKGEAGAFSDEWPRHTVQLVSFFIGQTPITQAQWREVAMWTEREGERWGRELIPNPSRFQTGERGGGGEARLFAGETSTDWRPVECVSWEEAMEFCERLSQRMGRRYTLPSEAQWEYACRAGTTTPFAFGETLISELANYDGHFSYANGPKGKARQQTTPVGMFPANAWGLLDMHGNVWEWCLDDWHGRYEGAPVDGSAWFNSGTEKDKYSSTEAKEEFWGDRLLRGGSWILNPRLCRSAFRLRVLPDNRDALVGFRVCCLPQD